MSLDVIYDFAKKNNVCIYDNDTYINLYDRCVEKVPSLTPYDDLVKYSKELLDLLDEEYGLHLLRIFAVYPLIHTKDYHGFDVFYLYENHIRAMGYSVKSFIILNKITEDISLKLLQMEFKKRFDEKYGFLKYWLDDGRLLHIISMIDEHNYDKRYASFMEEDLRNSLISIDDKYFIKQDLTEESLQRELYKVMGAFCGFYQFRRRIFYDYDGFGNVVSEL